MITNIESISTELVIPYVKPIIITSINRPPGSPVGVFDDIKCHFGKTDEENREWVIAGDLNCDLLKPRDIDTVHIKNLLKLLREVRAQPPNLVNLSGQKIFHLLHSPHVAGTRTVCHWL